MDTTTSSALLTSRHTAILRVAVALLVTAMLAVLVTVPSAAEAASDDGTGAATAAAPGGEPLHVRVNVGGPRLAGEPAWQADSKRSPSPWITGVGTHVARTRRSVAVPVEGGAPPALYATSRYDLGTAGDGGELRFVREVPAGRYEVRLHLAETYGGSFSTGARVFDVVAEGQVVLRDVDAFAAGGPRRGVVKTFEVDVVPGDGRLDVELRHGAAGHPRLNGIEVVQLPTPPEAAPADVLHVSPRGDGERDGSSWDDAATLWQLPELLEAARPGSEVWLHAGLGEYQVSSPIGLTAGGEPGAPVTVRGVDEDGEPARARIIGERAYPYDPDGAQGKEVFRLLAGADHLAFRDLDFRDVGNGAFRIGADITDLSLVGMRAVNVRRFVENAASGDETTASVSGLVVREVEVHGYSRGAIRLRYDSNDVVVADVLGDAQRQDRDPFAIGVHLSDTVHDVLLERVTMRNSHDTSGSYWNGDGFATERQVHDVVFRDTVASGNTDGGYDLKSRSTRLVRPIAFDNKRNFRIWRRGVTIEDCVGRDPNLRGGTGSQAQVQLAPRTVARITGCTFTDDDANTIVYHLMEDARLTVGDTTHEWSDEAEFSRLQEGAELVLLDEPDPSG